MNEEENKDDKLEKSEIAKREEEVLKFWQDNQIFKKTGEKETSDGDFVFYDGPPFATGLPHYGHILAGTIKDAIPRYQTMLGKKVNRKWGWDCHGLPLENLIEKELGLKTKKDIEEHGIAKFNETAKVSVLRYADDWKKIVPRMGRWVDMENDYKTMDTSYSESVWWAFKNIYDKGLIYEGFKSMHLCPRCETTLSNFEVNQGYKDIKDISVTAKFELVDEPNTFVLAWTTTPWTLPGNVALAINPKIDYVKIKMSEIQSNSLGGNFILAKERLSVIKNEYEILEEIKDSDLIGKRYKPVFDYYKEEHKDNNNIWKIYGADFVTTEDGTGVVHIAPAFGDDDLKLAQKENIPIIHHVNKMGLFKKEVVDFAGEQVKPREDNQKADIEIIKNLAGRGLLFAKEKIEHSYPHCWRCETPLLNYATSSWFVKASDLKEKLIGENAKVNWIPKAIGESRFKNGLESAPDWAMSRTRFWGAPLPVWKCSHCKNIKVIGSIEELKNNTVKSSNNYFLMRHGEAENNILDIVSCKIENNHHHLTEKGKEQVKESVEKFKKENLDLIISSPFLRTKETAEIVAQTLGDVKIIVDERIREDDAGVFDGKNVEEYHNFSTIEEKFYKTPENGENLTDIKKRLGDFIYDIDKKYSGKNILFVTHEYITWLLRSAVEGLNVEETVKNKDEYCFTNAEIRKLDFAPISHNDNYVLDLHRPYIDNVEVVCDCGGKTSRVEEVFDCWFESGSMPFASNHYPFDKNKFDPEKGLVFPADFIAEGLDQTRGWFYTLLVLSTALFGESPYKNVIVNGLVLAEDGQKMSKSKKNYPDPMNVVHKYGADALRFYLLSSPVVRAEDLNFSEKGVDEILKKLIIRLKNVYSFYDLYKNDLQGLSNGVTKSENVLDKWILARLNELVAEVTDSMNKYELDKATKPIMTFIDDLSTWYLRRSRERFKGDDEEDKNNSLTVTRFVLQEFSKVIAPFTPFVAEEIYQKVKNDDGKESVHLDNWPTPSPSLSLSRERRTGDVVPPLPKRGEGWGEGVDILEQMEEVRRIVSLGLEARAKAGIKVRQPLTSLKTKSEKLKTKDEFIQLIKDEVNVKEVVFDGDISDEVELNTEITPELKDEGLMRDLLRNIQDLRKKSGLTPSDVVKLQIETSEDGTNLIKKFEKEIKKVALLSEISFTELIEGEEIKLENNIFSIAIFK